MSQKACLGCGAVLKKTQLASHKAALKAGKPCPGEGVQGGDAGLKKGGGRIAVSAKLVSILKVPSLYIGRRSTSSREECAVSFFPHWLM